MLNHIALLAILVICWLALVRFGWVSLRRPEVIDDFTQTHLTSVYMWSRVFLPEPSQRYFWIRLKGVVILGLMIALAIEVGLSLVRTLPA